VRIVALALADENQRFARGYPAKGSPLALRPNVEIQRLAGLVRTGDEFRYIDQRVEPLDLPDGTDLVLCHIDLFQDDAGRDLAHRTDGRLVFFGREATLWGDDPPDWVRSHVVGDVAMVWDELTADVGRLQPSYRAGQTPRHVVPDRSLHCHPELDRRQQTIRFAHGCACPEALKPFCPESLYYGSETLLRPIEEIVGEVISLPGKRILLLDDDVARWPDYYTEAFRSLWSYRREWIVNASDRLFEHPRLVRLLAKAGVRAVVFDESLLLDRLDRALVDPSAVRRLYRKVKSVQAAKMLVGARVAIPASDERATDHSGVVRVLRQMDLDFIFPRSFRRQASGRLELVRSVYRPMLQPTQSAWIVDQFYSLGAILDRVIRRPRRVGFYTTAMYLAPRSLAARQDFYEGLPVI
jgi:hypothetical protein